VKRIHRSISDRFFAGVCGGLGETFDLDPTLIRLLFVFLAFVSGFCPLLITYLVAWIIIPRASTPEREAAE